MDNATNETKDITPEIARQMTQEAIDWEDIVQKEINDRVPDTAKAGKRECRIVIGLPDGMRAFTKTTQDIIQCVFLRKGWKIKHFDEDLCCGAVLVDIAW